METHVIRFLWIVGACLVFITLSSLAEAQTDVVEAQLGGSAILGCEISYHSETTWLKHRLDGTPLVVIQSLLNDGRISYHHRANARLQSQIMGRSLALNISLLEESDLGLYYCMGMKNKMLKVGTGKWLKERKRTPLMSQSIPPPIYPTRPPARLPTLPHPLSLPPNVSSTDVPGTNRLPFSHLYAAIVGIGVIGMVLAVVITHLTTRRVCV